VRRSALCTPPARSAIEKQIESSGGADAEPRQTGAVAVVLEPGFTNKLDKRASGVSVAASPRRSRNFGRFNVEGRRERAFGQAQHFPLGRD